MSILQGYVTYSFAKIVARFQAVFNRIIHHWKLDLIQILSKTAKKYGSFFFWLIFLQWLANYGVDEKQFPTIMVLDASNEVHYTDPDVNFKNSGTKEIEHFLDQITRGEAQVWRHQKNFINCG